MKNWRSIAEVIGIVSIVAGLILVAWEIRQANDIAKAQMVMDLAAQANEFNSATYENAEVARLVATISDPDDSDFSADQESMMNAAAWHFANIFWSAQRAHDNGLLGDDDILMYQSSLAWHLDNLPGLRPAYKEIYDTAPWLRDMFVFQPLAELAHAPSVHPDDAALDVQFNHVTLLVSDIEESAEFYREILLLNEIETPWGEIPWGRMFSTGTAGELHLAKGTVEAESKNKQIHYAFSVSNFDAYLEFLTEHDVDYGDFEGNPGMFQTRPDGVRQVYLQDPDGYWIEVNSAQDNRAN